MADIRKIMDEPYLFNFRALISWSLSEKREIQSAVTCAVTIRTLCQLNYILQLQTSDFRIYRRPCTKLPVF
jgi:hypothetical protein